MRQWQQLQGQGDPIYGILSMHLLLDSIKVLTFTVGEPHRQTPVGVLGAILKDTDESLFEEVQFNVVLLTLAQGDDQKRSQLIQLQGSSPSPGG